VDTVRLNAAGSVSQTAAGTITAAHLGVRAGTGILLGTATNLITIPGGAALFAATSTAGNIKFLDAGDDAGATPGLVIGTVSADGSLFSTTSGVTGAADITVTNNDAMPASIQLSEAVTTGA